MRPLTGGPNAATTQRDRTHVLSLQTPVLGNRVYGELLRRAFAESTLIDFEAHWSTEAQVLYGDRGLERQLDRLFLKMMMRPWIRRRNLDFFPLRYEIGTSYWARRTLNALLRGRRPDVLHIHSQAIAMLATDVMGRIPTVVSADGTSLQMAMQQLEEPWRWTFAPNHVVERLVLQRAAAVVTFSHWAARSMIADHGLDARRVRVIPPGIDLARFADLPNRRERSGPLRLLFVGGEFERKGGPLLVDVFLSRFAENEGSELHIVTNALTIPAHPRIFVHTGVAAYSEAWHRLYRDADVFVMPTKRDQSPIVFLEAMAAGLPVVTTAVGSATEAVLDNITGYVVNTGDAAALGDRIESLLADGSLRARFGTAGRAHVETHYEARQNARTLERLFLEVGNR